MSTVLGTWCTGYRVQGAGHGSSAATYHCTLILSCVCLCRGQVVYMPCCMYTVRTLYAHTTPHHAQHLELLHPAQPTLHLPVCLLAAALLSASPDFQTELGYELPPPGGANLATASKANAQAYRTLSLVLEMPFKDTIGWFLDDALLLLSGCTSLFPGLPGWLNTATAC